MIITNLIIAAFSYIQSTVCDFWDYNTFRKLDYDSYKNIKAFYARLD